jgi:hypothetical protein
MAPKPAGAKPGAKPGQGSKNRYNASDNSAEYLEYFGRQYKERWPALLQALLQPTRHVALENPHVQDVADVSLPAAELAYSLAGCKCFRCACGPPAPLRAAMRWARRPPPQALGAQQALGAPSAWCPVQPSARGR